MSKKPERREIATTLDGRDITRPWVDRLGLQSSDDAVLLERGGGDYALYREVLRDDHVMAALQQRRRAVIACPWEVRAGGKRAIDRAAADFLRENLDALGWDAICDKMLMGVFYGFAVGECLWAADGRHWRLADVRVRDRRRFGFDHQGGLLLKTLQQPLGEPLGERKFWVFASGADHDDAPYGLGLAHWLYWPVWFKRHGHRFWATYLERFGAPAVVGKYAAGTGEAEQRRLLEALRALQRDAAIAVPEGIVIELLQAARSGSVDHAAFVQAMNTAILVAAIGQTASTQGTPGRLGGDAEQGRVRQDIVRADADLLSASFNASVARWLTEWNYPGAQVPGVWRVVEQGEDLKLRAERDLAIYQMGYQPTQPYIEATYGGQWQVRAAVAEMQPALPAPGGAPTLGFAAPEAAQPPWRQMSARLAPAADAEVARMLASLELMIERASSLEEARAMLEAAWPQLDDTGLRAHLEQALLAAELAGRAEAQAESSPPTRSPA